MKPLPFILIGILIILVGGFTSVHASFVPAFTITTDDGKYHNGETIKISGNISPIPEETTIIIQIWKDSDMIDIGQINLDKNGNYSHTITAEGPGWSQGEYIVRASHGDDTTTETSFTLENLVSSQISANIVTNHSEAIITITMNDTVFYLDSPNKIIRAFVEIQNYNPSNGVYFMKVTHLPTQKVMKDFEIYPRPSGNDLWGVQIAYPILESSLKLGDQILDGDFEIHIRTEFGSSTANTEFSIYESSFQSEPETPLVENIETPIKSNIDSSLEEFPSEPEVDSSLEEFPPEPEVDSSLEEFPPEPEVDSSLGENNPASNEDFSTEVNEITEKTETISAAPFSIQEDKESIQTFMSILPYLGIIIAILVGITFTVKIKRKRNDDYSEDYEYDNSKKDYLIENASISKKFKDMQEPQSDSTDEIQLEKIIKEKLDIISKLEKFNIGNHEKLEEIKKSLIDDGSFTQEDHNYLEEQYEYYKKLDKDKI